MSTVEKKEEGPLCVNTPKGDLSRGGPSGLCGYLWESERFLDVKVNAKYGRGRRTSVEGEYSRGREEEKGEGDWVWSKSPH